jgi:hypothetical protein
MGNFVEVKLSPGEIIGIANSMRQRGVDLTADVRDAAATISDSEGALKSDKFTDEFRKGTYDAPQAGAGGATVPQHQALKDSASFMAGRLEHYGEVVAKAMISYSATDAESGKDIAKSDQPTGHTATHTAKRV